jgi:hypothetical protein
MIEAGSRAFWRATLALCLGSLMIFANVYVTQPLLPVIAHNDGCLIVAAGPAVEILLTRRRND